MIGRMDVRPGGPCPHCDGKGTDFDKAVICGGCGKAVHKDCTEKDGTCVRCPG